MTLKRSITFLLMLLLPAWQALPVCAQSPAISEYQIKAAFLYNFAKFVDWPPNAPGAPCDDFKIGILGEDPFGAAVGVIENKRVRGKPLKIFRAAVLSELSGCEVIFIGASVKSQLAEVLTGLHAKQVLTVGDTDGYARQGVMINLITVGNKIRFQINPEAAERAGLKISSHLLRLADIVN